MPPSAMAGMPVLATPSIANWMAEICGTPTPATMRVVQIEPGPDADLHRVGAVIGERLRAGGRGDVAAHHLHRRIALLHHAHALEHALRMAVRGVDDDHVDAGRDQRLHAFVGIGAGADRGADAQASQAVLARQRVLDALQDVLDGDEAAQLHVAVDHQHPLDPVLVHEALRVLDLRALRPR